VQVVELGFHAGGAGRWSVQALHHRQRKASLGPGLRACLMPVSILLRTGAIPGSRAEVQHACTQTLQVVETHFSSRDLLPHTTGDSASVPPEL
jgi:hypothetical protein